MFKQIFHIALAALTVFGAIGPVPLLSGVAHAASPNSLSYQGRLKDDAGVVVADGAYDFTFTLWTDVAAGVADWTEAQTLTVTDGYFSAQLGAVDPFLNGAGQETDFTVPLWLAVEVEAEALTPRVAVNSVAYSFSSRSIESYANEAAAEADSANFGGRMYYNTTDGNLYVYDSVAGDWADTTAGAGGADDLDDAYNNFGAGAAVINVDNAQGQGNLRFTLGGTSDVVMIDASAETFVTFADDGSTTIAKALAANGTVTLGDNGDTVAINSSDWDITTAGNMTGIGTIDADGAVNFTSTLAVTGNTTLTGDLAVNGDDITSDGDLTITVTGGQLLLADTNVFNIGGVTGQAYNAISNAGGVADSVNVANDNDLYIQDDLEVDGTSVFDGNTDLNGTVTVNAVTTFNASPVFNSTLTADGAIEANGGITTQDGTALVLNSGDVDAISIGNDADAESINIGTGAATKTITIGNGTLATVLNIDTGTGGVDIDLLGAMSVDGELLVVGGAADGNTATGDADLYVVGDFETDGIADFDGSFDFDGTTFDVDGSGLVSFTSTGSSVTVAASDSGNIGDDSVVLSAGNAAPDAAEDGNDVVLEAEDDILLEATDNVDIDAADLVVLTSGAVAIDTGAASNFTTAAGALTLNGNGGVNVVGNAAEIDLTTSGAVDVNSGAGTWDASTLSIDSTDTTNLTMTANDAGEKTLAIAATNAGAGAGRIGINSDGTISIDAVTASNFTVTGAADLTLSSTAGSVITSGGEAAADAIRILASNVAGGIDMDAGTAGIDVDATGVMSFDGELVAIGGAADGDAATGDGDLYVVGDFEVDATSRFDGASTFNGGITSTAGEVLVSGGNVQLNDNVVLALGTGNDFELVHDGVNTTLTNITGTFDLSNTGGSLDINASAGAINIGNDADAQAINVGTGAAARAITVGNGTLGTALNFDTGTGGFDVDLLGVMSLDGELVVIGGAADGDAATGDGDLYVVGDFEVDGTTRYDGAASFNSDIDVTLAGTENVVMSNTTGDAAVDMLSIQLTNTDTTAAAQRGLVIQNASNAAVTVTESLIALDNLDADALTDGLLVSATGAITDAIDVSAANITNALNVGANSIVGAGAEISFSEFTVSGTTGSVTVDDGGNAGQVSVEGSILDINSLGFVGAGQVLTGAGTALTLTGGDNGTEAGEDVVIDGENWNVSASGLIDTNGGLNVTNGNIALSDDQGLTWSIDANGVAQFRASVGISGTADGTDALTLTNGDIFMNNGDLDVNGGDFNVILDAGDGASISSNGATTNQAALSLSLTTDATNLDNANAMTASLFLTDYADDGFSDNRQGINVTVTNNASDAGVDDAISGVRIQNLGGVNQADGSEYALRIGTGWDADVLLGNFETFSNQTDDIISFSSGGGTNNQNFSIDLDAVAPSGPTLFSSDGSFVLVNDNLSVGIDGNTTENILQPAFSFSGNDLYVDDMLGVNGSIFTDGNVSLENSEQLSNVTDDLLVFTGSSGINNASITFDLDANSVGNVPTIVSGGSDLLTVFDSLSVGIDGNTTENLTNPTFAFGAGNDLYVDDMLGVNGNIFTDGMLTLQGTGDGNDSIVVTTGDILVSDGDFDLSGGDFNVTLDGNDSASIFNGGNSNSTPALAITNTYTNNANSDALTISQTLQSYADDGVADQRTGATINVTNNDFDNTNPDDTIYGLSIGNLTGANSGPDQITSGNNQNGSEFAIKTGTNWDADVSLGNGETISNQTNNNIVLAGNGTNKAAITFDLEGASASAVPSLVSGGSDLLAVFDSLSVGIDGETTENIANAGFAFGAGDDLYVQDDVGINGNVYVDGPATFDGGLGMGASEVNLVAGTTPSVSGGSHFLFENGTAQTITDFTNGYTGQLLFIRAGLADDTLDCTGSNLNCGTTDIVLANGDGTMWFKTGPGNWQLVAMMDQSDNHNAGNGFDLAEWFPSEESLAAGDIVSVDPTRAEYVRKSQGAYESSVIGIVSTNPGYTLGEPAVGYAAQIALAGRVPVNVTNENGAIVPGDYLTTSSTPGVAMKATEPGPVVGIAMDSFDGASGQVVAKIANFWYVPPTSSSSSLQGSDGSVLSAGVLTAESVVVSGNAVFEGSVTVEGHLYGGADMAGRARINVGDTRVYVPFTEEYAAQPIVTATLRTATDIPGYWWVEGESTTGFYIVLDGTLAYPVEFNWIALGVQAGRVSVSDGSSQEINVYVVSGGAAPVLEVPQVVEVVEAVEVVEEPVAVEAPAAAEEPVAVEEPVVEPAPEPVVVEEPVVEPAPEPVVEEVPVVAEAPTVEIIP